MSDNSCFLPKIPGALPGSRCSSRGSSPRSANSARTPSVHPNHEYCAFRSPISTGRVSKMRRPHRLPTLNQRNGSANSIKSRYTSYFSPRTQEESGEQQRSKDEDCIKCMLKMPHTKCEAHKYIRIGGGYRHSYAYVKAMLEELELQRQKELLLQQRLEAITEGGNLRAIKTYIRTKSGRLVERIVFLSEEDYQKFKEGGKFAEDILKKYLTKEEGAGLQSWEKEEQKAVITYIRTKSGRRIQKIVYVSKEEYEAMKRGDIDANALLKKYLKPGDGETIEGWGEAEMKAITTYVRTKSGRLIEKTIMVSKEDYERLQKLQREGGDPSSILGKYMSVDDGAKIEGWKKNNPPPMKVVKAFVRTKSGRLIEKTILMTEEEYAAFQAAGGDPNALRKYLNLGKDDVIEDWEKASTVYADSDDEELLKNAIPGSRIVGKDGHTYEIVIDPITGKKYKKRIGKDNDADSGFSSLNQKKGKGKKKGPLGYGINEEDPNEKGMTKAEVAAYRAGGRRDGSDSEYSYKSVISAGGTRHVKRRRRRADGTYSDEESYHSDQDEAGKLRRQKRRGGRKAAALKEKKERFNKGKRNNDSDSDFSYRSVVSAGGTRHVKRRRKRADGTYSDEESYHSSQDGEGMKRRKQRREKRKQDIKEGKRNVDSDSDFSYRSVISAGGTRHVKRRRKRKDGTYSDEESYHSGDDVAGKERRKKRRQERQKAFKQGKRNADSESEYSYRSIISAGGTRHVKRRKKRADGTYSAEESYHSSQDEDGQARRRRRRRDRKHAGSAHSYYSVTSAGGTRHVRRKRKNADGTYGDSESYHSEDSDLFEDKKGKKKKKRREHGSDSEYSYFSEVSAGGTRTRKRKKRLRDAQGKVIGHGKVEDYSSSDDFPSLSMIQFKGSIVSKRSLSKSYPGLYMKGKAYGPRNGPQHKWKISPNGPKSGEKNTLKYQYIEDYEDSDIDMIKDFSKLDQKIKQKLLLNQMRFRPLESPTDEAIQQLMMMNHAENQQDEFESRKAWDSPTDEEDQDISTNQTERKCDVKKLEKYLELQTEPEVQQIIVKNQGGNKYDFMKLKRSIESNTDKEIEQIMFKNQVGKKYGPLKLKKASESPTDREVRQILSPNTTENKGYNLGVTGKLITPQLNKLSPLGHNFKKFETYSFKPPLTQPSAKQYPHRLMNSCLKKENPLSQIQEFLKTASLPHDYYLPSYYDYLIPAYGLEADDYYSRYHKPSQRWQLPSKSTKYNVRSHETEPFTYLYGKGREDTVRGKDLGLRPMSGEKLSDYDKDSQHDAKSKPRLISHPSLIRGKQCGVYIDNTVLDKQGKMFTDANGIKQEVGQVPGVPMETNDEPSIGTEQLKVIGKIWKKFHPPKEEKTLFLERGPYQYKPYQFRSFDQFVKHVILKKPKLTMDNNEMCALRDKYDEKPFEYRHLEREVSPFKKTDKKQPKENLFLDHGKYKETSLKLRDLEPSKPMKQKTGEKETHEKMAVLRDPYDLQPLQLRDLEKGKSPRRSPDTSTHRKGDEKESLYFSHGEYKQIPYQLRTLNQIKEKDKQKRKIEAREVMDNIAKDSFHDQPFAFRVLSREKLVDGKRPLTSINKSKKHMVGEESPFMNQGEYTNPLHRLRNLDQSILMNEKMKMSPQEEEIHKRDVYDDHQMAYRELDKDKAWNISQLTSTKKNNKETVQRDSLFLDPGEYKNVDHQFRELDPNAPIGRNVSLEPEGEEKANERQPFVQHEHDHEFREMDKGHVWDVTQPKAKGSNEKLFLDHGEFTNTPYQFRDLDSHSPKGTRGYPTHGRQRETHDGGPIEFREKEQYGKTRDKRASPTYEENDFQREDSPLGNEEKVYCWDDSSSTPAHKKNKEPEKIRNQDGRKDTHHHREVMDSKRQGKPIQDTSLGKDRVKDQKDSSIHEEDESLSEDSALDYEEKVHLWNVSQQRSPHMKSKEKEKTNVHSGSRETPHHIKHLENTRQLERSRGSSPERSRDFSPEKRDASQDRRWDSSPDRRMDSSPERQRDSFPERRNDSSPERRWDSSPERRNDSSPERRWDSSPERRWDSSPERRKDSSPERRKDSSPERGHKVYEQLPLSIVVDDYTKLYPLQGQGHHIYSPLENKERISLDDHSATSDTREEKIPEDTKKLSVHYDKHVRHPQQLKSFDTFLHANSSHKPHFLYQGRQKVSLLQIRARSLTVKDEDIFKKKFTDNKRPSSSHQRRSWDKSRLSDDRGRKQSRDKRNELLEAKSYSKIKLTKEDLMELQGLSSSLKHDKLHFQSTSQPKSSIFLNKDNQRNDTVYSPIHANPKLVKINLKNSMKGVVLEGQTSHIMPPEEYRRHLRRKSYEINREEIAKHHVLGSLSHHSALNKSPEPSLYMNFGKYEDPKYMLRDLDKGIANRQFSFRSSQRKKDVFLDHGKYLDPKNILRNYDNILPQQSNVDIKKKDDIIHESQDHEKSRFKDSQKQSHVDLKDQKSQQGIKVRGANTEGLLFMDQDQYKDPKYEFRDLRRWTTHGSPDKDAKLLDKHDSAFKDLNGPQKQTNVDLKVQKSQPGIKVKGAYSDGLIFMDQDQYKDPKNDFRDSRRWTTHVSPDKHDSAFMDYGKYKDLKTLSEFKRNESLKVKPVLKKSTEHFPFDDKNETGTQRSSIDSYKLGRKGKAVSFIEMPQISKLHDEIENMKKSSGTSEEDTSPYLYRGEYSDPILIDTKKSTSLDTSTGGKHSQSAEYLQQGEYDKQKLEYRELDTGSKWDISQPGEDIWRFPESEEKESSSQTKLQSGHATSAPSFHQDSSLSALVTFHERSNSSDLNLTAEKLAKQQKLEAILTPTVTHHSSDVTLTAETNATEQGFGTTWTNRPHLSFSADGITVPSSVDMTFTPSTHQIELSPSADIDAEFMNPRTLGSFSLLESHLHYTVSTKAMQPQKSESGFSVRKRTLDATLSLTHHDKIRRILQVKGLSPDSSNESVPFKFGTKPKRKHGVKDGRSFHKVTKKVPKIRKFAKMLHTWNWKKDKMKKGVNVTTPATLSTTIPDDNEQKLIRIPSLEESSPPNILPTPSPIKESEASSYEYVSDGKGGKIRVKKEKKKGKKKGRKPDEMTDFSGSLASTDSEDEPDLSKMTEEEKKAYFEAKAKRKAEREKKRREKYGDKYDEMMGKHKLAQKFDFIEELQAAFGNVEMLDPMEVSLLTERFLRKVKKYEDAPFSAMIADLIADLRNPILRLSTNPLVLEMMKMSDQLSLIEDIRSDLEWNDSIAAREQLMDEFEEESKMFRDSTFDGIISNLAWTVCDPEPRQKEWDVQFENAKDHVVRPPLCVLSEMRQAIGINLPSEKAKMHRAIREQGKKLTDPMIKAMVEDLIKLNSNPKKSLEEIIRKFDIVQKYAGRVDPMAILDDLNLLVKSTKNPLARKHLAKALIQKANGLVDPNFKALVIKTIKLVCDPNVSSEDILTTLAQVRRYSKRKSTVNFLDDLKYLLEDNDNPEELLKALKQNGSKIKDPGFQAIYQSIIDASNDPETSPEELQKLFDEAKGFAMRTLPISLIDDIYMILETQNPIKRDVLVKAIMEKVKLLSDPNFEAMVEKLTLAVCDPSSSQDQIRILFENASRYAASMEEQCLEEIKEKFDFLRNGHVLTDEEYHEIEIRKAASYMAEILLEINSDEIKTILKEIGDTGAEDVLEFLKNILERLNNLELTMDSVDKCLDMCLNYFKGTTSPEKFREFFNSQAKLLELKEKMKICRDTIKDPMDREMFVALLKKSKERFYIEPEDKEDPLAKEAKQKAKSMVSYQKGKGRKGSEGIDERSIGLAHEEKDMLGVDLNQELLSPTSSDDEEDKKKLKTKTSMRSKSLPGSAHKGKISALSHKKSRRAKSVGHEAEEQEHLDDGTMQDEEVKQEEVRVEHEDESVKEDDAKQRDDGPGEETDKQEVEEVPAHEKKARRQQKLRRAIERLNRRRVAAKTPPEEPLPRYTVTEVRPKTIFLKPIRIPYKPSFEKKTMPVLPVFTDSTDTVELKESVKSPKSISQPESMTTVDTTSVSLIAASTIPSLGSIIRSYQESVRPVKAEAKKRWKRIFFPDQVWGGKKKGRKNKDGHEGDDESDEAELTLSGRRRKKKGARDDDEESLYEYVRDKDGNVVLGKDGKPLMKKIGTVKKGKLKPGVDPDDSDYEYRYDKEGNLVRKKRGEKIPNTEFKELESDEELFETLPDGTIRLKPGKKKIDLSKLTDEELRKLGLDPKTMTKEQMARILKERFGADIEINLGGQKVGLKALADFGSDANTDDLADDSDLDTSTLRGARRIRVLMKRGGEKMKQHMKSILDAAALVDPHPEEKEAAIQFLEHYKLVDTTKLEPYIRAFVVEDEDMDGLVYPRQARIALEGVPFVQGMSEKQMDYVFTLLDIDRETGITFRMFAVMSALCERVTAMDQHCKKLIEISNLADIERKMALYREMFYCNVKSDRDSNYITSESLKIELIAGGLSWPQQEYVMEKMEPNDWREISFLDYLSYIPLFMSMHEYMCDNPLDMSNNKYGNRPHSPPQRDANPLGYQLKKTTRFNLQQFRAKELKKSAEDMLGAKKKLPSIKSKSNSGSNSGFLKSIAKK